MDDSLKQMFIFRYLNLCRFQYSDMDFLLLILSNLFLNSTLLMKKYILWFD